MILMQQRSVAAWLGAVVTVAITLTGCGTASEPASDSRPSVVAAFYPYFFLAQRIGGTHVHATNLTPPGVEPHDMELTPRQVADVHSAELVIYQRGFQPALDDAVAESTPEHVVEVGWLIGGGAGAGGNNPIQGSGPDAANDPHIWLDPIRFATVATAVGEALAAMDSVHAGDYATNAKAVTAELTKLDKEFQQGLTGCRSQTIVTNHAAFGHLAARYGLEQVAISGIAPEAEPSPAQIAAVARLVREHNATTIFVEPLASPKAAQTLAADVGVQTAVLDPLEGLTDRSPDADYFSGMRANLDALRKALTCP
jgi:zinc transport system substrate-binding protein